MQRIVIGIITSAQISVMGKIQYGFLGVETDEKEHIKVKVTAFTKSDTLDIGTRVRLELEPTDDSEILNAKTISLA